MFSYGHQCRSDTLVKCGVNQSQMNLGQVEEAAIQLWVTAWMTDLGQVTHLSVTPFLTCKIRMVTAPQKIPMAEHSPLVEITLGNTVRSTL